MRRILVVSDTHGDCMKLKKAIDAQPTAEVIIHCGDGEAQGDFIRNNYPNKMLIQVKGNCDWNSSLPSKEVFTLFGKRFFITHGHLYNAKLTMYNLMCAAREEKADILLFGHTHEACCFYDDGLYIMNPGACSGYRPSYGYIEITDKGDIGYNTVLIK